MSEGQIVGIEHELLRDSFIEFERGVLQDNVFLCDAKAGLLLTFTGAMVIFCLDAVLRFGDGAVGAPAWVGPTVKVVLVAAGAGFLVSSHFSLTTVMPRIVRGRADHIFWESPVFNLSADDYVAEMRTLDPHVERDDKLRHLHLLAGICRGKYRHFQTAMRFGRWAFLVLVAGEALRLLI